MSFLNFQFFETNFSLVQEEDDLMTEEGYFHPEFTNQVNYLHISQKKVQIQILPFSIFPSFL